MIARAIPLASLRGVFHVTKQRLAVRELVEIMGADG